MATRIIFVRTGSRSGLIATGLAIVAIVALFGIAIATDTSLAAVVFLAIPIVACVEQFCRRNSEDLTIGQARRELDRIDREECW